MRSKEDFQNYLSDKGIINSFNQFSPFLQEYLEDVYCSGFVTKLAPYITSNKSEEKIFSIINNEIKDSYKPQGHNIGKGLFKKYFKRDDVELWMKILHYYISVVYYNSSLNKKDGKGKYIHLDRASWSAGNRKIAIAVGILSEDELDPEVIEKASRKITDALAILKYYLKVINVEQTYNPGMKGSGHKVTLIFSKLIKLFDNYDVDAEGSIRFRKTIRKRIISFMKDAAYSWKKALDNLIKKQKHSYLLGLVSFDVEEFTENKNLIFSYLKRQKWLAISKSMWKLKNVIPHLDKDHTKLTLEVKNRILMEEISNASKYLISDFKDKFNINLTVVASC